MLRRCPEMVGHLVVTLGELSMVTIEVFLDVVRHFWIVKIVDNLDE